MSNSTPCSGRAILFCSCWFAMTSNGNTVSAEKMVKDVTYGGFSTGVTAVAFSVKSDAVYCGTKDGELQVRFLDSQRMIRSKCKGRIECMATSKDGKWLVVGTTRGVEVRLAADLTQDPVLTTSKNDINWNNHSLAVFASLTNSKLLTVGNDSFVTWDTRTLTQIIDFQTAPSDEQRLIWSVSLSPDETKVALGTSHNLVEIYATSTGKLVQNLGVVSKSSFSGGGIEAVRFSPDGQILAAASNLGDLYIWDTNGWNSKATLRIHQSLTCLEFSTNGKSLAVTGRRFLELRDTSNWSVTDRQIIKPENEGSPLSILALAYSRDGRYIAIGCSDHAVRIYAVRN